MASDAMGRSGRFVRVFGFLTAVFLWLAPGVLHAAPKATFMIDARTGEVLQSYNADTRLHPASLTKMMTLYVVFEAVENGEITLDTMVTISANAAAEPASKIGFRAGQKVRLRYLIRAAAVKSANDASTALGEAISGSEAAFAARMNRTAKALGMSRTHFINMHGLTQNGHVSTARDMTTLGRHLFYDYPDYYHLFSRRSVDVAGNKYYSTNRRFLNSYEGADGIKTGYTRAAGSNLVASARRGNKHIIATIFGAESGTVRDQKMAELMDRGFRKAGNNVAVRAPSRPPYQGPGVPAAQSPDLVATIDDPGGAGKTVRVVGAPLTSPRPKPRPGRALDMATAEAVVAAIEEVLEAPEDTPQTQAEAVVAQVTPAPRPRPMQVETEAVAAQPQPGPEAQSELELVAQMDEPPVAQPTAPEQVVQASLAAPQVVATPAPRPRPEDMILTRADTETEVASEPEALELVTRLSTSGGRHWGINVGTFGSRGAAEEMLLMTALGELSTLGEALRKVAKSRQGFNANFVGMTEEAAGLACRRLAARNTPCTVISASDG